MPLLPGDLCMIGGTELDICVIAYFWAANPMNSHSLSSWHARPSETVLTEMGSAPDGLSEAEAEARRAIYGWNVLPQPPRPSAWKRFRRQFDNALIYVLLGSAVVAAFLDHWVDVGVIVGVVLVNALIGYIQEGKAEEALEAVRRLLSPHARVWRGGHLVEIPARELVPGDIVVIEAGDRVPADLRLLRVKELRIDESTLTGESVPITKTVEPLPEASPLSERTNMAWAGTLVTYGQGTGIVVATGSSTEVGRITTLLTETSSVETPLLRKLNRLGRYLIVFILAMVGLVFIAGLFQGYTIAEMFMVAIAIAVAAIPEGLPAIITITLAIGVQVMARRRAIVRRLPAVEALGAVTVICSDKTGTFTKNEMTVRAVITAQRRYEVTGAGYAPEGDIQWEGKPVSPEADPDLLWIVRVGLLCNEAQLLQKNGQWILQGDPTEGALLPLAHKAGLDPQIVRRDFPRLDLLPFASEKQYMASLHHDPSGRRLILLKGAPERVFALSGVRADEEKLGFWRQAVRSLAGEGMRVLAFAWREVPEQYEAISDAEVETGGFHLLGVAGMIDPPRPEAIEAVSACHEAGIQVKMVTGDHPDTALAIAQQLGLKQVHTVITGTQIEQAAPEELIPLARHHDVFARVSPEHKYRLVEALKRAREIVAMTGDGVNDAPALQRADVGIAMGQGGTEAAKEAADIVLTDDNFATIAAAIHQGRTIYDNILKAILFILPTNFAEAAIPMAAVVLDLPELPMLPVHILWVNMVTAVTLAISLAFESPEEAVMKRPPRPPDEPILTPFLLWRIPFVGLFMTIASLYLFEQLRGELLPIEAARTATTNLLVMGEIFYLLNARQFTAFALHPKYLWANPYSWLSIGVLLMLQIAFTYAGPLQALLNTASISSKEWREILLWGVILFCIVEVEKFFWRKFLKKH